MMVGLANVWLNSPWIRLLLTCAFDYCWLGGIIWWYGNNINDDDDVDYDNDDESDDDNDDDDSRVHVGPHVCLERWLYSLSLFTCFEQFENVWNVWTFWWLAHECTFIPTAPGIPKKPGRLIMLPPTQLIININHVNHVNQQQFHWMVQIAQFKSGLGYFIPPEV